MKKIAIATLFCTAAVSASAANFVQIEEERARGREGASDSHVTYVRAGKDFGNTTLGLQTRTARFDAGGVSTSMEVTMSDKRISALGITPFVGVGHDFGNSGFYYGVVGATTGFKVGPGFAYAGVKTRVMRQNDTDPTQLLTFAGYDLPITKGVSANVGFGRSDKDIKENSISAGLRFSF